MNEDSRKKLVEDGGVEIPDAAFYTNEYTGHRSRIPSHERIAFLRSLAKDWADAPGSKQVKCRDYARDVGFLLRLLAEERRQREAAFNPAAWFAGLDKGIQRRFAICPITRAHINGYLYGERSLEEALAGMALHFASMCDDWQARELKRLQSLPSFLKTKNREVVDE